MQDRESIVLLICLYAKYWETLARLAKKSGEKIITASGRGIIMGRMYRSWSEVWHGFSKNAFGLMMSLNMLIETDAGFDFSFGEFTEWVKEAGFKETSLMLLTGPSSAAIAIK